MYNPTQNLANQLANPYTYSPSGGATGASGLIKGGSPIQHGWGDVAFKDPEPVPTPAPAPAPTGLVTGGGGSSGNGSNDSAPTPIPGVAPPAASVTPPTTTKNGTYQAIPEPPKIEGLGTGGVTAADPQGLLSQIGLKKELVTDVTGMRGAELDAAMERNRTLGLDAKNYDIEGFLAANAGRSWKEISAAALLGGLNGGVIGAVVQGVISAFSKKEAVVDPKQAETLKRELQRAIDQTNAANTAPESPVNPEPIRVTDRGNEAVSVVEDSTPLSLPEPYQAAGPYAGYLAEVDGTAPETSADPTAEYRPSVTDIRDTLNESPYGDYLSSVSRAGVGFSSNGGIAGGNSERGDSW